MLNIDGNHNYYYIMYLLFYQNHIVFNFAKAKLPSRKLSLNEFQIQWIKHLRSPFKELQ